MVYKGMWVNGDKEPDSQISSGSRRYSAHTDRRSTGNTNNLGKLVYKTLHQSKDLDRVDKHYQSVSLRQEIPVNMRPSALHKPTKSHGPARKRPMTVHHKTRYL